ncbi:2TM domain-containing protein [Aurantibacter aestuarii]|uniref:Histidine kinase n=1 Tax=Aurantibacter aestuarii TaxID=1266046 RepID=A0A2T1N5F3_9FLAO|nr:2TM domain-containing protein [Aurantibacter aestuarii]PSG86440.1 histidine kinase [Aurantibacter aestuarii]
MKKNIIITFCIGTLIFLIGSYYFKDFKFLNANELLVTFVFYQLYAFVLGFSNMLFFKVLHKNENLKAWYIKSIIGVLGSGLITLLGLFLLRWFTSVIYNGNSFNFFITHETIKAYQFGLWITLTVVIIFHVIYYYNSFQKQKLKEQKVIAGTANAKFDALKSQLDPHFLFNSLNVLNSLIEENKDKAQDFTTGLSKVYRYVLEQKNKELVSLEEELAFARIYMSLLKMRFEDSLKFEAPKVLANSESKVVPLSLQLVLENAVKHNVVNSKNPLKIVIKEENGALVIENNIQPKKTLEQSSGFGLTNITQRYQLLTHRKVQVLKNDKIFRVSIPILTKQIEIMKQIEQYSTDSAYLRAQKRVDDLKGFYSNLMSYCIIIPFLIGVNYYSGWGYKWFWFPMFGWGIGLCFHAFGVFGFGNTWEQKQIKNHMDKELNKTKKWN